MRATDSFRRPTDWYCWLVKASVLLFDQAVAAAGT